MEVVKGAEDNPLKQQLKSWQEQTDIWQERIDFLKKWIKYLKSEPAGLITDDNSKEYFETKNKIWELEIEIEAKENAIDKRKRDMGKAKLMLDKQMTQLKNEWESTVDALQKMREAKADDLQPEHRQLINGIIKRAKRKEYRNGQQQFQDLELAKNLLASQQI